jgi:hypothetical protein
MPDRFFELSPTEAIVKAKTTNNRRIRKTLKPQKQ